MTPQRQEELVKDSARGNGEAYGHLVRLLAPSLMRYVYGMIGNHETAEEVTQSAFVRAYRSLGQLREPSRFRGWLWRIARFAAYDRLRQERRRHGTFESLDDGALKEDLAELQPPGHDIMRLELLSRVHEEINELPPEVIVTLRLRYEENLSYEQMANRLGIPASLVKSRLGRARARLRPRLKKIALEWKQISDETS